MPDNLYCSAMNAKSSYDALALLSGGLDSILAARLIMDQGLKVKSLHFVSPFFGKPHKLAHWARLYGLDISPVDISQEFAAMLAGRPPHGVGKSLNPCLDCKILMLSKTRLLMEKYGAKFIISGEVLGQRPMSQRRDTLNVILRDAQVKGLLLRPLCARLLEPTQVELDGLVDREKLLDIHGRGRTEQLAMAERYGLKEIPTPGGGCLLTERENARSYWPIVKYRAAGTPEALAADFNLANTGRQYWHTAGPSPLWLAIGRNQADNDALLTLARTNDLFFKTAEFPGPVALGRQIAPWNREGKLRAAAFIASFSPKAARFARENNSPVKMRVHSGAKGLDGPGEALEVTPARENTGFAEYPWAQARQEIRLAWLGASPEKSEENTF